MSNNLLDPVIKAIDHHPTHAPTIFDCYTTTGKKRACKAWIINAQEDIPDLAIPGVARDYVWGTQYGQIGLIVRCYATFFIPVGNIVVFWKDNWSVESAERFSRIYAIKAPKKH